ncbi:protein-export chaperone SecB [Clostridium tertium]|uniref:protein-export chaperone SecB n=1 Tax=Clostridium tertium TaxID=1559 RepID=UPI00356B45A5
MNTKAKSKLRFKNYIVESIDFKSNFNFSGEEKSIEFDLENDYEFEDNNFILTLEMEVFPDAEKNDYPFSMRVRIIGLFEVESESTEKEKIDFAEKNSIAILFPYIRSLISVYTSNANIGTTIIPPINVVKYLENKKKKGI